MPTQTVWSEVNTNTDTVDKTFQECLNPLGAGTLCMHELILTFSSVTDLIIYSPLFVSYGFCVVSFHRPVPVYPASRSL